VSFILGLTGGIASGKSTVSDYFKRCGIPIIDADVISKEIVEVGTKGLHDIVHSFGETILTESGELDRQKLGRMIFADPKKRTLLNQILHPTIKNKILSQKEGLEQQNAPLIILDIPLLYEANYESEVDEVMVVYVNHKTQKERLMERGQLTGEEAENRINAQMDLERKRKLADIVIDNSGTIEETYQQVSLWLSHNGYITE